MENFRSLIQMKDLSDRRVTTDPNGNNQLQAPKNVWGRFVHWIKGDNVGQQRGTENMRARETFYNALVKSEGKRFAEHVLRTTLGVTGTEFKSDRKNLQGSTVKQLLQTSDREYMKFAKRTEQQLQTFDMQIPTRLIAKSLGHETLNSKDPEVRRRFVELVKADPGYGHKVFTHDQLSDLAEKAVRYCCNAKKERFNEQYGELAKLGNAPFHDTKTYFRDMRAKLDQAPLNTLPDNFKNRAREALTAIEQTAGKLARMEFDPAQARQLKQELQGWITTLGDISTRIENANLPHQGPTFDRARDIRNAFQSEIANQIDKVVAKVEFLDGYLKADPLSDKAIAYDKLFWVHSTKLVLQEARDDLQAKINDANQSGDQARVAKLQGHLDVIDQKIIDVDGRILQAQTEWLTASPEARSASPHKGRFTPHVLKNNRDNEARYIRDCCKEAGFDPGTKEIKKALDKMHIKALDTIQEWNIISRDMVVTRDGVTRTYRSIITPGAKIGGVIGQGYERDGLTGVSAGNKTETDHARNLQVSELYRVEKNPDGTERLIKCSQTIRHGVLDPWDIEDPDERTEAQQNQAKEVLTTVVEINDEFKAKAIQKHQQGGQPLSKIVHVNLNLTTADTTLIRKMSKDYREGDFTLNQFKAFEHFNGTQTLQVQGPQVNGGDGGPAPVPPQDVQFDIDTITFSFGVNEVAMGKGIWSLSTEDTLWGLVEQHDRENLVKLVGDLTVGTKTGGYIGGLMDDLRAKLNDDALAAGPRKEIEDLLESLQTEVDITRQLFTTGSFKNGIEDAYKMVRHIMRVVDLGSQALTALGNDEMVLSLSQGCKSNKDRGGMGDVEHKAQVIIEDMGGKVLPGQTFETEDQIIYNTVLTSSGQSEVQQLNTGLPGSKNAGELEDRIVDGKALEYSRGFSEFTKA
jgi:phosphatidylinositol-4,5-bisphosphate 4-phosphatase